MAPLLLLLHFTSPSPFPLRIDILSNGYIRIDDPILQLSANDQWYRENKLEPPASIVPEESSAHGARRSELGSLFVGIGLGALAMYLVSSATDGSRRTFARPEGDGKHDWEPAQTSGAADQRSPGSETPEAAVPGAFGSARCPVPGARPDGRGSSWGSG
jgi:hypothetical protein